MKSQFASTFARADNSPSTNFNLWRFYLGYMVLFSGYVMKFTIERLWVWILATDSYQMDIFHVYFYNIVLLIEKTEN